MINQNGKNLSAIAIENFRAMRFNLTEFSGGLGDLGTFIPLAAALSVTSGLDIGTVLIFAGLFNIATGFLFGLPIPVQPMKAIAAVAIAEMLAPPEIAAAGLLAGAIIFFLGITGWVQKVEKFVPLAVVRGIQLGVGIKLAVKGIDYIVETPITGIDSILTASIFVILTIIFKSNKKLPMALVLLSSGLIVAIFNSPDILNHLKFSLPTMQLVSINPDSWKIGFLSGTLPQLPLTILNSVLAVCVLSGDLFPAKKIAVGRMATSVGIMNLASCWFGGMPMCHGSGGLAGQFSFGARTGGSVVMLGLGKLMTGLFLGSLAMFLLQQFPGSILGVMLIFAGITLALPARDIIDRDTFTITIITTIGILAVNTAIGFMLGISIYFILKYLSLKQDD